MGGIYRIDSWVTNQSIETLGIMLLYQIVIGREDHQQTLAAILHKHLEFSWEQARRIIRQRQVKVNRSPCTDPSRRIAAGAAIEVHGASPIDPKNAPTERKPRRAKPQRSDLSPQAKPVAAHTPPLEPTDPSKQVSEFPELAPEVLVYSDDSLVVVNKPAGLTTMRHSQEAEEFGERGKRFLPKTLVDLLPPLLGIYGPTGRLRPVHRIDRDTSGLVVIARTSEAERHLTGQFRSHTIERRYLALTRGRARNGKIVSIIGRNRGDGRRGSVDNNQEGKRAVTYVRVIEHFDHFSLVECQLETGRTHQVRIHLGEQGTPICGETIYDRSIHGPGVPDPSGAKRIMLHAARLGLHHPITREWLVWDSPLPSDFQELLDELRGPTDPDSGRQAFD